MTLTDFLPRLGLLERPVRKHRATDEVARLRHLLNGAHALIAGLQLGHDDKDQHIAVARARQGEAEELVVQQQADLEELAADRDTWRDEALALRARFGPQMAAEDNANRVDVPPMVRDTSAIEDQATGPIYVQTLWDALGVGPTAAVTDPGRVPPSWAREDDTVPVTAVQAEGVAP